MAFRLVTGRADHDHVTSDDMGMLFALTKGDGRYRLDDITCEVIDANTVHVSAGHLLIDGRHFRNSSEGTNLTIANGAQGMNRIDLIVCRYEYETIGEDYLEHGTLKVIQGTATSGTPEVPGYVDGSIMNNDNAVEVPLFTVPITGIAVGTPSDCLLEEYELPAKYGGTGIAVEIITAVRGAVEDATAAAAAANAAAARVSEINDNTVTYDMFATMVAQLAELTQTYIVVGETVFVPTNKGTFSGDEVTFYNASFNELTGGISLA